MPAKLIVVEPDRVDDRLDKARWKLLDVAGKVNLALYVRGSDPAEVEAELSSAVENLMAALRDEELVPKSIVAICVFILNQLDGHGEQSGIHSTGVDGTVTVVDPIPGPLRGAEPYRPIADRWRRDLSELFGNVSISG